MCGDRANEWDGEERGEYVHVTERMMKRGKDAAFVTAEIYV